MSCPHVREWIEIKTYVSSQRESIHDSCERDYGEKKREEIPIKLEFKYSTQLII